MKLFLITLFLLAFSSASYAAEDHSAAATFGVKAFFILLPTILPLFFIFNSENKLLKFIVCLGIYFGVSGVIGIPIQLIFLFIETSGVTESLNIAMINIYLTKFICVAAAIYVLRKYSNSIFLGIKAKANT